MRSQRLSASAAGHSADAEVMMAVIDVITLKIYLVETEALSASDKNIMKSRCRGLLPSVESINHLGL